MPSTYTEHAMHTFLHSIEAQSRPYIITHLNPTHALPPVFTDCTSCLVAAEHATGGSRAFCYQEVQRCLVVTRLWETK
jgi:hypothetical protein